MPGRRRIDEKGRPWKPIEIPQPIKRPYPCIVRDWDVEPRLSTWENELLWILNEDFPATKNETIKRLNLDPQIKKEDYPNRVNQARLSRNLQQKIRRWVDRWIDSPDPGRFSKKLNPHLHPLSFSPILNPNQRAAEKAHRAIPALKLTFDFTANKTRVEAFWLFALAWTLSQWGPKALGKCEICKNYFIDLKHRGKKQCSQQCTWIAYRRRLKERSKDEDL